MIVVQADDKVQAALAGNVRKIAVLLGPLIRSGRGELEVLAYGYQLGVLTAQPFTSDSVRAARAIADFNISAGPQHAKSSLLDAITKAISDLEARPANRRGIVLVLGKNDDGADKKLTELIDDAAGRLPNVAILFPLIP